MSNGLQIALGVLVYIALVVFVLRWFALGARGDDWGGE